MAATIDYNLEIRDVDFEIERSVRSGLGAVMVAKHMAPERAHATRIEEAARALAKRLKAGVHPGYNGEPNFASELRALDAALEEKP